MKHPMIFLILTLFAFSCEDDSAALTSNVVPPTVSIEATTALEGSQTEAVFISLKLNKPSDEEITVLVESEDVTAQAGSDYEAVSESIVFAPGAVLETLQLNIFGDEDSESDETFRVQIQRITGNADPGTTRAIITIENDDGDNGGIVIPSTGFTTPVSYDGMELLWSDEFEGEALNRDFWTFEIGNGASGWGNNELQYYREENTSIVDGNLVIQAKQESFGGFQYTSSRIITKDKMEFSFGRVDIRAIIPEGQGVWPALWMLGENINEVGWPRCGEVDIMELVGHQPSTTHSTVHYSNTAGQHVFQGDDFNITGGEKFSDEFHVFSIDWQEDKIEFFVDNNLHYSVTPEILGTSNPYPFNDPFFFIFNVAVGGNWPGSPDATTRLPQNMIVDYIRVFQNE